jgi:spore protease
VGKDAKRIGKTIQLTNAGIVPGSGVGVHRRPISRETMGIPVIAIGVPLVLDVSYGYFLVPKDVTAMVNNLSHIIATTIKTAFYE